MQSPRTKSKIIENLGLLKEFLTSKYGCPVADDTERILFNALSWTADDVENQFSAETWIAAKFTDLANAFAATKADLKDIRG